MRFYFAMLASAVGVSAFPNIRMDAILDKRVVGQGGCTVSKACDKKYKVTNADIDYDPSNVTPLQAISAARTNCGAQGPCIGFNAQDQYVSNTGSNRFVAPGKTDIRGPCPGLNAAANHGYLPRNGVANLAETTIGLQNMYGMEPDLGAFLAAYAIALDGDLVSMTWSIGGPPQTILPPNPLIGTPQGISWSHNKYEGDSSIARCDAYLNGGDAHSLSTTRFAYAYASGMDDDSYTLDKFSRAFTMNTIRSEMTNDLYFAPLFSTTLVSPAAYNFVINFMSNHSETSQSGYLNGAMFKQFFGVTGTYPNFKWRKGLERMPDNWYKRPSSNEYGAVQGVFGDLAPEFAAYPKSFRFGGNVNGVGTYTGIDIANFSGGVYSAQDLLDPTNLACFFLQEEQQLTPDELGGKAAKLLFGQLDKTFAALTCPKIGKFNDNDVFSKYPGYKYRPKGKATSC